MAMTAFRPEVDGFHFANAWRLDEQEKARIAGALGGVAVNDAYGCCGGMAFAALDWFKAGQPLPRGTAAQPERATAHDAKLRAYLYQRQIDSLVLNATTTLARMAILTSTGGAGNLWRLSQGEFAKLQRTLDGGSPWPIGILGTTVNPTGNHQALAIGYDAGADGTRCVYVYDSNRPNRTSTVRWNVNDPAGGFAYDCPGVGRSAGGPSGDFVGFFAEAYTPAPPPAGSWLLQPGAARDVAVGDDRSTWVIGTDVTAGGHGIYRQAGPGWQRIPGGAVHVAVADDGVAWVVNGLHEIFRFDRASHGWRLMPGRARDIGAGGGAVWSVGTTAVPGGAILQRWNGGSWDVVDGGAVRIDVDAGGDPWVVNDRGEVLRRTGGAWQLLPGRARDVAAGATGWIIGTNAVAGGYAVFRFDGARWRDMPGGAVAISDGCDDQPWAVNDRGQIFHWTF